MDPTEKHKTINIFQNVSTCKNVNILYCTVISSSIIIEECTAHLLFYWKSRTIDATVEHCRFGCTLKPASQRETMVETMVYNMVNNCGP